MHCDRFSYALGSPDSVATSLQSLNLWFDLVVVVVIVGESSYACVLFNSDFYRINHHCAWPQTMGTELSKNKNMTIVAMMMAK